MGKFDIILGLGVVGIGGYVFIKHIWPGIQNEIESLGDSLGGEDTSYEDFSPPPTTTIVQPPPVYEDRYPDVIVEDRFPDYVYNPPPIYQPPIIYPPPEPCPPGMEWHDGRCRVDCPEGFRYRDGVCKPRDCDKDEYFDGRRCRDIPGYPRRTRCDRDEYWNRDRNKCSRIPDCDRDERWDGQRCRNRCDRDEYWDGRRCQDIRERALRERQRRERLERERRERLERERRERERRDDDDDRRRRRPERRWNNGNSRDRWHADRDREQGRTTNGPAPPKPPTEASKDSTGTPETDRLKEVIEKAEKNFIELWLN